MSVKRSSSKAFRPKCSCTTTQTWRLNYRWTIPELEKLLTHQDPNPNWQYPHCIASSSLTNKSLDSMDQGWNLQLLEIQGKMNNALLFIGFALHGHQEMCENTYCVFHIVTSDNRLVSRHNEKTSDNNKSLVTHLISKNELLDPKNNYMDKDGNLAIICEVMHISDECQKLKKRRTGERSILGEDLLSALKSNTFSDVTIKTRFGKSFPAHRVVLSARSTVFAAMLSADMKESSSAEIYLDETNEQVEALLEYMYAEKVPHAEILDMLKMADKYNIRSLQNDLEVSLLGGLNLSNASEFLRTADLCNAPKLKEETLLYMKTNFKLISTLTIFRKMMKENPTLATELLLML